ncbi:hypothetical protein X740_18865 [Mesorhizobium sp. LNHC221B00]|nr:hypothetical protein X740_18865 [Mesorhizobium sp. LNHC221B00]
MRAIECRIRVLEDDLHRLDLVIAAVLQPWRQHLALELDGAAVVGWHKAKQQPGEGGLAAAGFADQPERFAWTKIERDVLDGAQGMAMAGIGLVQPRDAQHGCCRRFWRRRHIARRGARQGLRPVVIMAARQALPALVAQIIERRQFGAAAVVGERAAIGEGTALDVGANARQEAWNGVEPALVLALAAARQAAQERHRIGVAWIVEHNIGRSFLHQHAGIENADTVAHVGDDGEVVADEQDRGRQLLPELRDQVEHLGLDRRIEAGGRLIEDQHRGVVGQRHGDRHALLHAAGQLVWVTLHDARRIGDAHPVEHGDGAIGGCLAGDAAKLEDLGQLAADADRGVQRLAGVLIDHRDAFGASAPQGFAVELHHVLTVERNRAAGDRTIPWQIAHDGERHGGFAAAGFADQPVGLALADVEAEIAQHRAAAAGNPIGDRQVVQFEGVFRLCVLDLGGVSH